MQKSMTITYRSF